MYNVALKNTRNMNIAFDLLTNHIIKLKPKSPYAARNLILTTVHHNYSHTQYDESARAVLARQLCEYIVDYWSQVSAKNFDKGMRYGMIITVLAVIVSFFKAYIPPSIFEMLAIVWVLVMVSVIAPILYKLYLAAEKKPYFEEALRML